MKVSEIVEDVDAVEALDYAVPVSLKLGDFISAEISITVKKEPSAK